MISKNKIRIGSRGSDLALAQAYYIQGRIGELPDAPETELVIIKTSGDQIQDVPLSSVGGSPDERKGFFTKEIEDAMMAGEIDLAVHSFKDMPTLDVPGLKILSMPQRLQPLDIILIPRAKKTKDRPPYLSEGSVIGTSSIRRESQIRHLWPGIATAMLRGNVPTRIRKLLDGQYDAILLSGAGFDRLLEGGYFAKSGIEDRIRNELEVISLLPDEFVPAPAQGALALQCREDDSFTSDLLRSLHDEKAGRAVSVERDVLRSLEGGCHLPLGSHCFPVESGYALYLFLGKEAVDNRSGKSFLRKRFSPSPEILSAFAVSELKETLPVILTGRNDRIKELISENQGAAIVPFPLIQTETTHPSDDELAAFLKGLQSETYRPVLSVFSTAGAESLQRILQEKNLTLPTGVDWAVPGQKTADAVRSIFPEARIAFISPDNTGEGLARMLKKQSDFSRMTFFTASAKEGRNEFFDILKDGDKETVRMVVYRTENVSHSDTDFAGLPERGYVILGSPSAAKAYFGFLKRASASVRNAFQKEHRLCAIGSTTVKAVAEEGGFVYAVAESADYGIFLKEFIS